MKDKLNCEIKENFWNLKRVLALIAGILILLISGVKVTHAEEIEGKASWYSSKDACGPKTNNHKGCPTASGRSLFALEKQKVLFAAVHPRTYPMGTLLRVTNISTGKFVEVRVLDTGGFKKYNRVIDLGKEAFSKIAPVEKGLIEVKIERIK